MRWNDFKDSVKRFWADYKHQKSGMLGLAFLILLVLLAVAAPIITSPNVPKEWQNIQGWTAYPKNAPPAWENYFTASKAPSSFVTAKEMGIKSAVNGSYKVYYLTFEYNMKYAEPPKDIVISGLNSSAETPQQTPTVSMIVTRPREPGLKYNSLYLIYDSPLPSGGSIQTAYTTQSKLLLLYWLLQNGAYKLPMPLPPGISLDTALTYLMQGIQLNNTLYGDYQAMDPMKVLFGKATDGHGRVLSLDEILYNGSSLQGTYKFTVKVTAPSNVKVNFDNFKVTFVGRSYGLLGTDQYGRPIALGLLWGIRVALAIGISVSVSAVLIGIIIGVTSAYLGGWSDEAIQSFTMFMMTLPVLPMLILLSLYVGGKIQLSQLVLFLVLFGWMGTERVARSMALQIKEQTYVEAARALGASTGRIVFKHIIPQLLPYAFASIALSVPGAILAEAGLSFLNLTSQNMITWGQMLNAAHSNAATTNGYWWQIIPPGLAIAFVGLIFVLIGVSLDTVLNPRLRRS